jgi:SAM-dependent methyltransferase
MVGEAGGGGGSAAGLSAGVRSASDASAQLRADGAEPVYAALARALLAAADLSPAGARVLDVGAGTGTAGRAAPGAGARSVVSADLAVSMLRRCGSAGHPVAAEATALPFRDGSFDLVVAAFCLGHLTDPGRPSRAADRWWWGCSS